MTADELTVFQEKYEKIECWFDNEFSYFRNNDLPWYTNNPGSCTRITKEVFATFTPEQLLNAINRGLEVEHITRITGYFTKVSQWNKGKRGELRDRTKNDTL